jgi:hypothetical protein
MCSAPLSCDAPSGACVDTSCPGSCPQGTYCSAGSCVDDCHGAKCPDGQTCQNGQCTTPSLGGDGGLTPVGGDGSGRSGEGDDAGDDGGGNGDQPWGVQSHGGCGCVAAGLAAGGENGCGPLPGPLAPVAGAFALATLALGRLLRRRRVCARACLGRH